MDFRIKFSLRKVSVFSAFILTLSLGFASAEENVKVFSFTECLKRSLQKSERLSVAKSELTAAVYELNIAKSNYLPKISLESFLQIEGEQPYQDNEAMTVAISPQQSITVPASRTEIGTDRIISVGVELNQPIYNGGRTRAMVSAAEVKIQMLRHNLKSVEKTVLFETINQYFEMLNSTNLKKVHSEHLDVIEKHFVEVKNLQEAGRASEYHMSKARAELLASKSASLIAERKVDLARENLAARMEFDSDFSIEDRKYFKRKKISVKKEIAKAISHRDDLKVAKLKVMMMTHFKEEAQSFFKPQLHSQLSVRIQKPEFAVMGGKDEFNPAWTFGVGLSYNLYDGSERKNQLQVREEGIRQSKYELRRLYKHIKNTVQRACIQVQLSLDSVDMNRLAYLESKKTLDLVRHGYKTQVNTQLEVLDAQHQVTNGRVRLINTVNQYMMAVVHLEYETGKLHE